VEALGPVLLLTSLPFIFRLVPPNHLFGFRIPATLRNPSVWYDSNARIGRHLFVLGLVLVALEFVLPQSIRIWTLRVIATGGFIAVMIANWLAAIRLEEERKNGIFRAVPLNRQLKSR